MDKEIETKDTIIMEPDVAFDDKVRKNPQKEIKGWSVWFYNEDLDIDNLGKCNYKIYPCLTKKQAILRRKTGLEGYKYSGILPMTGIFKNNNK